MGAVEGLVRAQLMTELRRLPRGTKARDLYRLAYVQARLGILHGHCGLPVAPEAAKALAAEMMHRRYPGFVQAEEAQDCGGLGPSAPKGHDVVVTRGPSGRYAARGRSVGGRSGVTRQGARMITHDDEQRDSRTGSEERRWAAARTLRDYGELTAQWLEGRMATQPGYVGGVDVDEDLALGLTEALVALNRAGVVTTESQAGAVGSGTDAVRWAQLAAVLAITTTQTATWLAGKLAGTRFQAVISPVRHASDGPYYGVPVTWRGTEEQTWFGPVSDLMVIPIDAEVAVTVHDPVPGPNELWAILLDVARTRSGC